MTNNNTSKGLYDDEIDCLVQQDVKGYNDAVDGSVRAR